MANVARICGIGTLEGLEASNPLSTRKNACALGPNSSFTIPNQSPKLYDRQQCGDESGQDLSFAQDYCDRPHSSLVLGLAHWIFAGNGGIRKQNTLRSAGLSASEHERVSLARPQGGYV